MLSVNRFESNLLSILYALLDERPVGQVMVKILQPCERPKCLSRAAVKLVQSALAAGMNRWMVLGDGWKRERFLRGEAAATGRIWERTAAESQGLVFSRSTLDFLIWLTAKEPLDQHAAWRPRPDAALTVGDQLLLFRALETLRHTPVGTKWFEQTLFKANPLVALHFPDFLRGATVAVDFEGWLAQPGAAAILESQQSRLAERWVQIELMKSQTHNPTHLNQVGEAQRQVLDSFLTAAQRAGRLDLCRFLLRAMAELANEAAEARNWVRNIDLSEMRLADRALVYANAMAFLSFAPRLRDSFTASSSVGYFDDGYAAAQLWLADWEEYSADATIRRATSIAQALRV